MGVLRQGGWWTNGASKCAVNTLKVATCPGHLRHNVGVFGAFCGTWHREKGKKYKHIDVNSLLQTFQCFNLLYPNEMLAWVPNQAITETGIYSHSFSALKRSPKKKIQKRQRTGGECGLRTPKMRKIAKKIPEIAGQIAVFFLPSEQGKGRQKITSPSQAKTKQKI
jgi:hypothetical protein